MRSIAFLLLFGSSATVFAQKSLPVHYWEAGVQLGLINYSGDVAERAIELGETRLGSGVFVRYHLSSFLALKAHLFTGNISGSDKNAVDQELKERSLEFKSNVLEYSFCAEWNVLNIHPSERNGIQQFKLIPYLYGGIGGALIHSNVTYYGPPELFSQRIQYSLPEKSAAEKSLILPFGGGLRTLLTERVTLGAEGGWRYVFSDYLDGVSLNGSPVHDDWFFTATASISFRF